MYYNVLMKKKVQPTKNKPSHISVNGEVKKLWFLECGNTHTFFIYIWYSCNRPDLHNKR